MSDQQMVSDAEIEATRKRDLAAYLRDCARFEEEEATRYTLKGDAIHAEICRQDAARDRERALRLEHEAADLTEGGQP